MTDSENKPSAISRREFVQKSALAAGVLAAPMYIPSRLFGHRAEQTDIPHVALANWPQAFQLLGSAIRNEWTVILLDEVSWLGLCAVLPPIRRAPPRQHRKGLSAWVVARPTSGMGHRHGDDGHVRIDDGGLRMADNARRLESIHHLGEIRISSPPEAAYKRVPLSPFL